jgi:hypothetical protein
MSMNENGNGTFQLLAMIAGLMVAPIMAPALIWTTIAANLPLTLVIAQLVVVAVISKLLLRKLFRWQSLIESGPEGQAVGNLWSSEPSNG